MKTIEIVVKINNVTACTVKKKMNLSLQDIHRVNLYLDKANETLQGVSLIIHETKSHDQLTDSNVSAV
jgi:hypothetical protein